MTVQLPRRWFTVDAGLRPAAADRLRPFEPRCLGVEVAELRRAAAAVLAELQGRGNLEGFDPSRIPQVIYGVEGPSKTG